MSGTYFWTVILGLGVLTYLIRLSFLGLLAGREVPATIRRALGFVPVTVLPAMAMPMAALTPDGGWADPHGPLAAMVTIVLGATTRSLWPSILGGMAAFWGLRALGL